jgi:cytochrome c55X
MVAGLFADPVFGDGIDQRRAAELENLVRQDCGSCHGMTLKGGLGRPLTPDRLQDVPAGGLARIILDGVPGTPMPPWAGLISEEEAMWIAEHLRRGLAQ